MHRPPFRTLVASAIVVALFACAESPERRLAERVPSIPSDLLSALTTEDDSATTRWARAHGLHDVRHFYDEMVTAIDLTSESSYRESLDIVGPPLRRLARAADFALGVSFYHDDFAFRAALPYDDAVRLDAAGDAMVAAAHYDTTLTPDERISELRDILTEMKALGHVPSIGACNVRIFTFMARASQPGADRYLRRAIAAHRRVGDVLQLCQTLGVLGGYYREHGHIDSTFTVWAEAKELAVRHKAYYQAARLTSFFANHYIREGRLAIARELLGEVERHLSNYRGGHQELRFVLDAITFYINLGCIDIAKRLLARAEVLVDQDTGRPGILPHTYEWTLQTVTARCAMIEGDVDRANQLYAGVRDALGRGTDRLALAVLHQQWARGLLDNGDADRAVSLIEEGIATGPARFKHPAKFQLLLAEAHIMLKNLDPAQEALDGFVSSATQPDYDYEREWVDYETLSARLLFLRGDPDGAVRHLETALAHLTAYVGGLDGSAHSYLRLSGCAGLRWLMHEAAANDPMAGLGVELIWRELIGWIGRPEAVTGAVGSGTVLGGRGLLDAARVRARAAIARAHDAGAVHCVYAAGDEHVLRFTVWRNQVRLDTLDVSASELTVAIEAAWSAMAAADHGDERAASDAVGPLTTVGRAVLPEELRSPERFGTAGATAAFTTDGMLSLIPLEAANLTPDDGYTPLLARHDVINVRPTRGVGPRASKEAAPRADRPALLVANPTLAPALARRLTVTSDLDGAESELARAAVSFDDPITLTGAAATKRAVLASWEGADVIYVAAHALLDPEVPFLTLLPLAASDGGSVASAFVDVADVRAADLRACRLAILSGCATGKPYTSGASAAPSLGDAFVDAGAGSVIHTYWDVPDEAAARLMGRFVEQWRREGVPPARALALARRALLRDGADWSVWAAYTIITGSL